MNDIIETITLNDLTQIIISNDHFPVDGDFYFGNDKDNEEYINRFNKGELLNVIIEVKVFDQTRNIEASEFLGCCHVTSDNFLTDVQDLVKEYGMIEETKAQLNEIIKDICKAHCSS